MNTKKIKGTSLIEFAMVLPVIILLLFGIVEFSVIFYDKAIITNASREGARYGTVLKTPTYASSQEVIDYTKTYCETNLLSFSGKPATVTVTATSSSDSPSSGDTLSVTVTFNYTFLVVYNLIGVNQQLEMNATTVMAYE